MIGIVVIVSPNSLASPICQLEVAHAVKNNKRIVPVIVADPEEKQAFGALAARDLDENTEARLEGRDILIVARDNWKVIARHNWITFKDENLFEENFRILIDALETDPDYVRKHTRLLRAQEWVKNARTINAIAFSPDGKYVITGSDDAIARIWEVSSGREIRRFTGRDPVYYVGFSADGRTALTDGGSELRYWNIYPDDVVTTAFSHVYRDFTEAERAKYQLSDDNPTCPQFEANLPQSDLGVPFTTPIAT